MPINAMTITDSKKPALRVFLNILKLNIHVLIFIKGRIIMRTEKVSDNKIGILVYFRWFVRGWR